MRDERDQNYGDYSRQYEREHPHRQERPFERHGQSWANEDRGQGRRYRAQHSQEYGRRGGDQGMWEDYFNTIYDTNNYTGVPRHDDYGLPHGPDNDLDQVSRGNPQFYNPDSFERTRYRYSTGYNPNYDNPEEGDLYRNFDSRGNHGYRHDASYGNANEFRDFGNDHYGTGDRFGESDRYNR